MNYARIKVFEHILKIAKNMEISRQEEKELNGLRYVIGLCIVFFAVIVGLQGGTGSENQPNADRLRTTNVVEAFYDEGIEISLDQHLSPVDFGIEKKLPVIYEIPGSKEKLFIYEFSNMDQRNKALAGIYNEGLLENTKGFSQLQQDKECLINAVTAKNILLIYVIEYDSKIVSEIKDIPSLDKFTRLFAPNLENIKKIAFAPLNNGMTLKYQGSGQLWEGKAVLQYYQHSWKDQEGNNQSESWNNEDFWIKYLGKDTDQVKEIMCSFDGPAGKGQGVFEYSSQSLDQDGYFSLGSSGGNGTVNGNSEYSMTVQWGQRWETFVLEKVE